MRTECPVCSTMNKITYPDCFYYNKAAYECTKCGLKESITGYGSDTALVDLLLILSKIKKEKEE